MMSSRAASRIVIGVGLAVVFGIGVSIIMEGTQNQAANNPPAAAASSDQIAVNPPAADTMASLRNAATAPPAPSAVASPGPLGSNPPDAASQAPLNSTHSASSGSDANESSASSNDTNVPKPKHGGHHAQSTANMKSSAPPKGSTLANAHGDSGIGVTTLSSPPAVNNAVASSDAASAPNAESKPASEYSSDSSGSGADTDGQIKAQVRSSISSLAPASDIDVKAISGIVALAGSVPSQDVVEQARQAAQQVPGVKQVDTSALMVQKQ
jgi:osmotically-inducible protein OsmY